MISFSIQLEWIYLLYFLGSMGLVFIFHRFLTSVRNQTINQLNSFLAKENFVLYQELLNNKRLRLAFSKSQILLLKLKGYMLEGNDKQVLALIQALDQRKLRGYVKLDYLLKRFTYFVEVLNAKESKASLALLETLSMNVKNNQDIVELVDEARLTYQIYIEKNVSLIPKLKKMAQEKTNPKIVGIIYFRLAKLYYFNQQLKDAKMALLKAEKRLMGTYYMDIIRIAKNDLSILEKK